MILAAPVVQRGARRHLWQTLLALSVALNLFFIVGALWIRFHAPAPLPSAEVRLAQMGDELNLNAGQRRAFEHYSHTMRERLVAMHQALRPMIGNAWSEVGKPQAEEGRVMQLFDRAAEERRLYVHDLTTTTLSFLATLSPEQRAKFVQMAHDGPRPWSPPHRHDDRR